MTQRVNERYAVDVTDKEALTGLRECILHNRPLPLRICKAIINALEERVEKTENDKV